MYVEKSRVSFKITTQNSKNVIFIGFEGQYDLKQASKDLKNQKKKTQIIVLNVSVGL